MPKNDEELIRLREENARLVNLLMSHGIEWKKTEEFPAQKNSAEALHFSAEEKIALFRRLFRGRADVYPVRWESKNGKSGYSPACQNEWKPGVCNKPRIKCSECGNRLFSPVSDQAIYGHLIGQQTIGVYPLLIDDTCHFLAVDFDESEWCDDAQAFVQSCHELGVPAALEISRSGRGAHAWIFFDSPVSARDARRLGSAIISHACVRTRQLKLTSYDRLFPNQDSMPKGGFGNLIALPLQKQAREQGCSVFVDNAWCPYPDQWGFLASVERMSPNDIEPSILLATGGTHPLDVTFIDEEDNKQPWKRVASLTGKLTEPMPDMLAVTLSNQIYFEKSQLPRSLANRLIRLAAFQNPEFYKAQAMRLSVWDKPRVIGCAENYLHHIALPRGCLDAVIVLLKDNNILCEICHEQSEGIEIDVTFSGRLRPDQEVAVTAMMQHDTGVLCAPTAFGKTVIAAAMIARRSVNTLVLVHRTELLTQWRERLSSFLAIDNGAVGSIGGGKIKPTGKIDIAVMQSLSRKGDINPLVEDYGQIIVDECHHVGAVSFDAILRKVKAKYIFGLTATPIRRDGQQPIIFMQCGPIRHIATISEIVPGGLQVISRTLSTKIDLSLDAGIQDVFRVLVNDVSRTTVIATEIEQAYTQGRKVLVLTERTEHLDAIHAAINGKIPGLFLLHGRMSKKERARIISSLDLLSPDAPRVLLATGKLVGEGFDHPPLDTLVLAMPVSWKGTLQQYAGRLHRESAGKVDVRIVDIVDSGHPALMRMWNKRQLGYKAMGYRIVEQ